jgi:predicted AlkP superfamily pyrophosphatase or phosphodiesterase
MKKIKAGFLYVAAFLGAFVFAVEAQKPIKDLKPTVILIAVDGFRYDYPEKFNPPTINRLAENGVRAKWLIPSFPTKTFPNHYTVVRLTPAKNDGNPETAKRVLRKNIK